MGNRAGVVGQFPITALIGTCAIVGLPKSLPQVAPLYFVAVGKVN